MKTITLAAYKRPTCVQEALRHLAMCRRIEDFDRLAIFIDPGYPEVAEVCERWSGSLPIETRVSVNETRLGVAGNPIHAYSTVFEEFGSDFNVAVEDDALLSPDALELALWFYDRYGYPAARYAFFNLCDHYQYRGAGRNRGDVPEDPSLLAETTNISAPFAWCITRHQWPFIQRNWNTNSRSIPGWDWSIKFAMRMEAKVALTPVVSRCRNIGRFDGMHENAETFRVQLGLRHSDGSYRGDFTIVNQLSDADLRRLDAWMAPELPRYFASRK